MVKKTVYEIMEKKQGTKRWYKTKMEYDNYTLACRQCSYMNKTAKEDGWDLKVRIKK